MQRLKFCGTRNNRVKAARRFLVQKLQLYIKWLREDLGRMGTTESDVSRFLTHIIKWAKSQKDKKGRDDQFREGSWVSPPPFRSDLSFWPFFPNGISFVGKFLTSFGLIISLYKIFEKERTAVCSARTSFLLPGFLLSLQPTFRCLGCRWGAMRLEIPRFSHSLFFLSDDATPTPRPAPRHLPTRDNSPPF